MISRREFSGGAAAVLLAGCVPPLEGNGILEEMFGLIGEIKALPGKRDELIACLAEGTQNMPGNLAYLIAEDAQAADTIWITEVWQTRTDHENSLSLPSVAAAIAKARPILAGFGQRIETKPVGFNG